MAEQLAPSEDGLEVERALALLPSSWRVLDASGPDIRGARCALVVGPPGVFLVLGGRAPRGRVLDKVLAGLTTTGVIIAQLAGLRADEVHAVLCVSGEEYVDAWRHGVALCGPDGLLDNLQHRRQLLSDLEVIEIARRLEGSLRVGGKHRKQAHVGA